MKGKDEIVYEAPVIEEITKENLQGATPVDSKKPTEPEEEF